MIKIEHWSLCAKHYDPYKPPEAQRMALQGNVYGHQDFTNGTLITTAPIVDLDIANGRATTSFEEFQLGQADFKWVEWLKENGYTEYVNDIEKLISSLLN